MQSLGPFQALADELEVALGCRNAALRFLLKRVQHVDPGRELHRINRSVGVAAMIVDQFKHAGAAKASKRFCVGKFDRFRRAMPLERGLVLGTALILLGLFTVIGAISEWSVVGFGPLVGGMAMRLVIISGTTFVLGAQILYGSFFLYVLEYRAAPLRREPVRQRAPTASLNSPIPES
jgi:hypothetical protein